MKKVLFLGLALCLGVFAACKRDNSSDATDQMSFSASFEDASAPAGVSRAARDGAFLANDQIGIFVVPYSKMSPETPGTLYGSGNYADNVPFVTTNGTTFAPVTGNTIAYPNASTKVDVYAFGLYSSEYQNLGNDPKVFAWTVGTNQSTNTAVLRNDVMTAATAGVTPSATPVNLTFKHRLAKIDVTVLVPTTFRGKNVTGSALYIDGTRLKATIDMTDPTKTVTVAANDATNPVTAIQAFNTTGTATGSCTFQAIVLPSTVAAGNLLAHLELTLADGSKVTLNCRAGTDITYTTGQQTQLTLSIENENVLNLGTVAITAWTAGGNHTAVARRPARLIFGTAGNATAIQSVVKADLAIDDTTYNNVSVLYNATDQTLTCTYLQPTTRTDGFVKAVTFKNAAGTSVGCTFNPTFSAGAPLWIPKNPGNTDPTYAHKTSTATF